MKSLGLRVSAPLLYLVMALVAGGAVFSFVLLGSLCPEWQLINQPVHAIGEALGGLSAILMAGFLFQKRRDAGGGKLYLLALGLFGMGILDIVHASMVPGTEYVQLRCLSSLVGATCFALILLPWFADDADAAWKRWMPWAVGTGCVFLAAWTSLARAPWPGGTIAGDFTGPGVVVSAVAGVLFLAASVRLLLDFHCSRTLEAFLFACMAVLFGEASLMLPFSKLWNSTWWLWHGLRLAAYLLVLGLVVHAFQHSFASVRTALSERKQSEEALRETRDYLENLLNYANAPVIVWDASYRITRFNRAFERLTGRSAIDLIGQGLDVLFPESQRQASLDYIRSTTGERWETVEIAIQHVDGNVRTVLWNSATLFQGNTGKVLATIAQGQDITERKQAEEALRETRDYLENLLNYANAPVIVWDANYRITRFNRAFERLTGRNASDLFGQGLDVLFPESQRQASLDYIRSTTGERWETVEIAIQHVDGSVRTVLWNSATLFQGDTRQVLATIAQGQDITERKQAEEALRETRDYLENLLNYANAPVIVWDANYRITRFNRAFERLTGRNASDLIGQGLDVLFPENQRQASLDYIRSTTGERWETVEIAIQHADGEVHTLLWNSATLYGTDGRTVVATIAQGQDITERKRTEAALAHRAEELRRSNADLEQFAYVASHDLQEPLRTVASYVQLLARRYQGKLDESADEFISFAVEGARRMQSLINDLLEFSRLESRGQTFRATDCHEVLALVRSNLRLALAECDAELLVDPMPTVEADVQHLTQLFQNLVGNAIKFRGPDPPRIHVSAMLWQGEDATGPLRLRTPQATQWLFSVSDNGIGIDPKFSDRIFVIFQRLNTRTEYPGNGMGLAICQKIVQRHGGRIWVESVPGKGSTFYFTLPVRRDFDPTMKEGCP